MKVWQKVYLLAFLISVVFVNLGIYAVFHLTYQRSLESEQVRGETSYRLVARSLENTLFSLNASGRLTDTTLKELMKLYEREYQNQSFQIVFLEKQY